MPYPVARTRSTAVSPGRIMSVKTNIAREVSVDIACDMTAFSPEERGRYHALRIKVISSIEQIVELPNGYRSRLSNGVTAADVRDWLSMEQRCCAFLDLDLQLEEGGTMWLTVTGPPGVKALLESEFAPLRSSGLGS